ncbi:MAG TPA: hypothetical protein VFG83_01315, partial [Kofleriaceae bacterium]|nr:hypothetical protein [Kofleriaceae bacterium]
SGGNVLLAATGIEDHPRVKTEGAFQYIDSFVYLYEITPIGHAERLAAVDVSALGVVTPKWLHMTQGAGGGLEIKTSGYGAENLATLRWPPGQLSSPPVTATRAIVPGIAAAVLRAPGLVGADPLLDAWVIVAPKRQPAVVAVPAPKTARTLASRIGEAIFFSTLATPDSKADGPSSRFSCEACHYDGYVDGRTHFTGKKKVPAVTMPLHGLFGNRPHYSHALVPTLADLSSVVLMLVNLPTGIDPWFSIARADAPWLRYLGKVPERISPLAVREALMAFFVDYAQRPNPAVAGRSAFSATERRGAEVFHKLCARCHAPRLFADDPKTAAPFADWEKRIFSPQGPLVWASASYAKTGITPYFHKLGTRVPSLRRLYTKAPYFTNGAAENLAAVLSRAAASRGTFYHDGAPPEATRIPADDQLALAAFLRLL